MTLGLAPLLVERALQLDNIAPTPPPPSPLHQLPQPNAAVLAKQVFSKNLHVPVIWEILPLQDVILVIILSLEYRFASPKHMFRTSNF